MTGGSAEEIVSPWKDSAHPGRTVNQNNSDRRSPISAWQFQQLATTKVEPMDSTDTPYEDQNNQYGIPSQTSTRNTRYSAPLESTNTSTYNANRASNFLYSHLPLTPPDSDLNQGNSPSPPADTSRNGFTPNMASTPSNGVIVKQEVSSPERANFGEGPSTAGQNWSPRSSPDSRSSNDLESLQEIVQRNTMFASERHSSQSNDVILRNYSEMEQPKVTSSGKVKTYKCKNCSHISMTKVEFWEHSRIHIKPDKILSCRLCPFVTEFKHHLEYHILNHSGEKPFKCNKCDYRCVNKSMLSSHAKCHSDVHQYRCMDCNYASKYCHSLKLHLRKYGHRPSKVLNPDGTVNPYPIIDVYGTRRGPKIKQSSQQPQKDPNQQNQQINQPPLTSNLVPPLPYMQPQFLLPPPELQHLLQLSLPGAIPNPLFLQNIHRLVQEQQAKTVVDAQIAKQAQESTQMETDTEILDLSKPGPDPNTMKNRRKGLAHKLDNSISDETSDDDEENATTTMFSNVEVVQNEEDNSRESSNSAHQEAATQDVDSDSNNNNKRNEYRCDHCGITFNDGILHTIHMGFHGFNDPFACNVCGQRCKDKLEFYTHILRPRHHRDDA